MTNIIYVGMDVHTTNYTLCCYTTEDDRIFATVQVEPDYLNILKYLNRVKANYGRECKILCGYEAGCLGYVLYHQLTDHGIDCVILAPTTMASAPKEKKTDYRDAEKISKCLAYHNYKAVYVPTAEDDAVKEYIRMRDAEKLAQRTLKQQVLAFCTRHGKFFDGQSHWTQKHVNWLNSLTFGDVILDETFQEYLVSLRQSSDRVERFDKRIEELASRDEYRQNVEKLSCFIGIKTHTALSLIVEVGDFNRFPNAQQFSSYIGLVPGEYSSGDSRHLGGITKAGNSHLRRLLVESAQCYTRGKVGYKSMALKGRQAGQEPRVIAYADRANERLKRKFYKINSHSKRNIATTAVARELACFIWGMMTNDVA